MGFFKKIFKGIGKVFKKIGKGIKNAFKKIGKWAGKLGIFGQIAMSFIPGLNIFGSLFSKLGSGALNLLSKGLTGFGKKGLLGKIIKGASWMLDTPRKILGGITKGFKTVTSAATSFVSNTTKFLANKIPGIDLSTAPDTFFGTGGDSVFGRVGAEVSNNFAAFKDTVLGTVQADGGRVGGLFSGAEARSVALQDQLNITRIGGVEIDKRKLPLDSVPTMDPGMAQVNMANTNEANSLLDSVQDGINDQLGTTAANNFDDLRRNGGYGTPQEFLKEVQAKPGFVNEFINSGQKQRDQYFKFQKGATDVTNPFAKSLDDTKFFSKENFIPDFSTLPGDIVKSTAVSAGTQAFLGGSSDLEAPTRQAFNIKNVSIPPSLLSMPDVPGLSGSGAAFGLASSIDPYAFLAPIYSGMNMEGMSQGQFGLPGPQSFQPRMIS